MSTFFTSDLHLGHYGATKFRPEFKEGDTFYHDSFIVDSINSKVAKRDKLFILGDLAFSLKGMKAAEGILCQNVELILGNHDKYPVQKYLSMGFKVHGFRGYREFWLSHCPIHPNEMYRKVGNIHGHIHSSSNSNPIQDSRYINVNVDMNQYRPVRFETIQEKCK